MIAHAHPASPPAARGARPARLAGRASRSSSRPRSPSRRSACSSPPSPSSPGAAASSTPPPRAELVALTNQSRANAGLRPQGRLGAHVIARSRSKDMIARDYFSHSIPPGGNRLRRHAAPRLLLQVSPARTSAGTTTRTTSRPRRSTRCSWTAPATGKHHGPAWDVIGIGAYKGPDRQEDVDGPLRRQVRWQHPAPTPKPTPSRPRSRPRRNPEAHAEAHAQAHPEGDPEADRTGRRRRPTPKPTPEPTPRQRRPQRRRPPRRPSHADRPAPTPSRHLTRRQAGPGARASDGIGQRGPPATRPPGGRRIASRRARRPTLRVTEPAQPPGLLDAIVGGRDRASSSAAERLRSSSRY